MADSTDQPRRELRQRLPQQPYRPRPQLTSSNRGKAGAELRRQRELEANHFFTEAIEIISNVKSAPSSSSLRSVSAEVTEEGSSQQVEKEMENAKDRQSSVGNGHDIDALETEVSTAHVSDDACQDITMEHVVQERPNDSKKVRRSSPEDLDDEFDDDDGFFEQIIDSRLDFDAASHVESVADTQNRAAEQLYASDIDDTGSSHLEDLNRNRQAYPETNGFRWSNEKKVAVGEKAIDFGQRMAEKLKREADQFDLLPDPEASYSKAPTIRPPFLPLARPALAAISPATINACLGAARMTDAQSVREGKRKLQEEVGEISSSPFPPSSIVHATPERVSKVPRSYTSPLPKTPLPGKTINRLGMTIRSTPLASSSYLQTPNKTLAKASPTPRVALGMTPRRSMTASVPRFKTPFKDPNQQASIISHRSPDLFTVPLASKATPSPGTISHSTGARPLSAKTGPTVFDLERADIARRTLASLGITAECTTRDEIFDRLPQDVAEAVSEILRDPLKARRFAYEVAEGMCGVRSAHTMIANAAGTDRAVERKWVENHYVMILWKLAAETRHILDDSLWTWDEVCRQIKYRYEREFNRLHRSAVHRILRQTCRSSRAMVLCVFHIPPFNEKVWEVQTITLTDGWYRIQAVLDSKLCEVVYGRTVKREVGKQISSKLEDPLPGQGDLEVQDSSQLLKTVHSISSLPSFAASAGRIKIGTKLAIQGAHLETESDGADPLQDLHNSRLILGGNTTKLARWDAPLGFCKDSFVSTIRSLSAEGGRVPLMDVVITKIFPVAYTGVEHCPGYEGGYQTEWGEEEEKERREKWEVYQERAITDIEGEQAEELAPLERIVEQIELAFERLSHDEPAIAVDPASCEQMVEAIIAAGDATSYLRFTHIIPQMLAAARKRLNALQERIKISRDSLVQHRMGNRQPRSFRCLRVRDAAPSDYERPSSISDKRERCQRTALIKIWDYNDRIEASLAVPRTEGDHFVVTDLIPTQTGGWPKIDSEGDVYLASYRESIWRTVKRG